MEQNTHDARHTTRFEKSISFLTRHSATLCWSAALLIIISGIAYSIFLGDSLRYQDEKDYYVIARHLVDLHSYTQNGVTATSVRPPGYPFFLALLASLGGNITIMRIANFLLLAFITYIVYRIADSLGSKLSAAISVLFVISYPVFFYTAGTLYPQTITTALFLIFIYTLTRQSRSNLEILLAGISCAAMVLTTPFFAPIMIFTLLWFALIKAAPRLRRDIAIMSLIALLGVCSWSLRGYLVFHKFFFISTNSGVMLLAGNSENTTPNSGITASTYRYMQIIEEKPIDEVDANRYLTGQAIHFMMEHKAQTTKNYFLKLFNYFNYRNKLMTQEESSRWRDLVMLFTYSPLLILTVLQIVLFKKYPLTSWQKFFITLYLFSALVSAIFFTRIRYRVPFDTLLIMTNALFVRQLIQNRLGRVAYEK